MLYPDDVARRHSSRRLSKGLQVKRIPIARLATQGWMLLITVFVLTAAGFAIVRLHSIFGSRDDTSARTSASSDIVAFNPKRVLFEVFGPPGSLATINYLDINAQPQRVDHAPLPWTYDTTTTQPAVFANVVAQGDGDSIGCRITIDGAVKDERTVNTMSAYTSCLDKSG
jgi:hypothetical protein